MDAIKDCFVCFIYKKKGEDVYTGGFNLQLAFSTGCAAAMALAV